MRYVSSIWIRVFDSSPLHRQQTTERDFHLNCFAIIALNRCEKKRARSVYGVCVYVRANTRKLYSQSNKANSSIVSNAIAVPSNGTPYFFCCSLSLALTFPRLLIFDISKALMTNVEVDARASKSPLSHSVFTCETYDASYTSGALCSTSEWVFAWVALKLGENVYHFTSLPVFAQPHIDCRWGVMREQKRGKNIIRSISVSHSLSPCSVFS